MCNQLAPLETALLRNLYHSFGVSECSEDQLKEIGFRNVEWTGTGFFADVVGTEKIPFLKQKEGCDAYEVYANGPRDPIGYILYVEEGRIFGIQAFTFGEPWPENLDGYTLQDKGEWIELRKHSNPD